MPSHSLSLATPGSDASSQRPRLAVVISHPIQHFAPLFRELSTRGSLDLKVFYCCDWGVKEYRDADFGHSFQWNIPLLDGYDSEFLPIAVRPRDLSFFSIDNPDVSTRLSEFDPDAVWVHGYGHRTSWRVFRWAKRNQRRILYFGDSEQLAPRGWKSRLLKRLILPRFFAGCDRFLTIGDHNENYYRHYGVADNRMIRGSFPVDVSRFQAAAADIDSQVRDRLRAEYGLRPDAVVALFVGKFIGIKRPLDLVHAVSLLRDRGVDLQAFMLGSGPLDQEARSLIAEKNLGEYVVLPGFVNQAELPRLLALGDLLVMPSEKDPHPLVVTEAMSVGNAIVASDRVGCVGPTDAARPEENTCVYQCGNIEQLAKTLQMLAESPEKLQVFRQRSRELVWTQDVGVMADAVDKAVKGNL
ncbi:MAG: glycosyltransferase family 4 protein [Planctomycetaceae bacterium]|nr:glycosyltransferase family 4 protein [Planctomycetaceae bacterium]